MVTLAFMALLVIFTILQFPKSADAEGLKTSAGCLNYGPEKFLCSPNQIQNLKKNRYFDHFSSSVFDTSFLGLRNPYFSKNHEFRVSLTYIM
jgi:hypothetical protein